MNLGADVTRIWEYRSPPVAVEVIGSALDPIRIILRHNPVTQTVQVIVGKKELALGETQFKLGRSVIGRVSVKARMGGFLQRFSNYRYSCFVEDENGEHQLKESLELMSEPEQGSLENVRVRIPEVVEDGNKAVWYKVEASITQVAFGEKRDLRFDCHRRFRDFRFAYKQLLSAYKNHHLVSSLPKHPPREFALVKDHSEEQFLRDRQVRLEGWLRNTLQFPRAGCNPDILQLLGLGDPNFREVSIVIAPGQSLGLKMKKCLGPKVEGTMDKFVPVFPQAAVLQVVSGADGRPGIAAGKIFPGDVITRVAGESVVQMCYEQIIPMLRAAPKPLVVHFLTSIDRGSSEGAAITGAANDNGFTLADDYVLDDASQLVRDGDGEEEVSDGESRKTLDADTEEHFLGNSNEPEPVTAAVPVSEAPVPPTPVPVSPSSTAPMFARSKPKVLSDYIKDKKQETKEEQPMPKPAAASTRAPAPAPAPARVPAPVPAAVVAAFTPAPATAVPEPEPVVSSTPAALEPPISVPEPIVTRAAEVPPVCPTRSSVSDAQLSEPEPSSEASFLERDIADSLQAGPPLIPRRAIAPVAETQHLLGVDNFSDDDVPDVSPTPAAPAEQQHETEYNDDDLEDVSF